MFLAGCLCKRHGRSASAVNRVTIQLVVEIRLLLGILITCFDYTKVLDIGKTECSWLYLFRRIRETYSEQNNLEETTRCSGGLTIELRRLTGTVETTALYDNAMVEVETVGWELVLKQILQCAAGKSRGRQYIDNKASCRENEHCRNDDPGDSTDSCWTTTEGDDGMKMNIK
ncbi:hypothetical protein FRACYDRAFT_244087 [Fragilariopsis cylindrus CCMP1102]|uniref:Uncharacterized protein n=1 Tax=Fragilariopsis cylindrus CCMP1102 TaxID=635003 RepID=A0A1E7F3Q4_9STRA|nr:hypothetical protein FRACYDRAFT_244087 [Fragilariopsis cylindrus CCMP1102]|eukprot:OEU12812.1 hypothetical protein FRACYDRAFT_244087 [Fragilariopsis cylindrus CCMP1102]